MSKNFNSVYFRAEGGEGNEGGLVVNPDAVNNEQEVSVGDGTPGTGEGSDIVATTSTPDDPPANNTTPVSDAESTNDPAESVAAPTARFRYRSEGEVTQAPVAPGEAAPGTDAADPNAAPVQPEVAADATAVPAAAPVAPDASTAPVEGPVADTAAPGDAAGVEPAAQAPAEEVKPEIAQRFRQEDDIASDTALPEETVTKNMNDEPEAVAPEGDNATATDDGEKIEADIDGATADMKMILRMCGDEGCEGEPMDVTATPDPVTAPTEDKTLPIADVTTPDGDAPGQAEKEEEAAKIAAVEPLEQCLRFRSEDSTAAVVNDIIPAENEAALDEAGEGTGAGGSEGDVTAMFNSWMQEGNGMM